MAYEVAGIGMSRVGAASEVTSDYVSGFAFIALIAGMAYALVVETNPAFFAVLFLLVAVFYNPTKFTMGGREHKNSDVIL